MAHNQNVNVAILLNALIENFHSGFLLEDKNRNIMIVNQRFCDMFYIDISPEQLVGYDGHSLLQKGKKMFQDQECFYNRVEEIIINEQAVFHEQIYLLDGRTLDRDYVPIENLGSLWQFRDITSYKETESLLKKSKEEVEKLYKTLEQKVIDVVKKSRETDHIVMQQSRLAAMGEMIGNIGHQWRQPLNILSLYIQDIKDSHEYNELTCEYLDEIVKKCFLQIRHMSRTINDFRNFFHPHKEAIPFSIIEQIKTAISIISSTLEEAGITICFDAVDDKQVNGFPNEFSQVIINLLINCRDVFEKRCIKERRVQISIENEKDTLSVLIADNGGGIPNEIIEKVFDPYFTTKINGSGVGLYMSKMIMEHMKGTITVENKDGGATFNIQIPILNT